MSLVRNTAMVMLALTSTALSQDRLPDGGVATAKGGGVVQAWYGEPTERYDHGILGDRVEAGSLIAVDADGARHEVVLPHDLVFEDLTPRLADLDGDGSHEVVTIRTNIGAGAAIAVYGMRAGELVEIAATAPIGLAHRWLSIAAIADFTSDPGIEIAIVKTPHIGGVLELLSLHGPALKPLLPPQPGYSTHVIGSRELSLARAQDIDGDGYAELALPDQARRQVIVVGFTPAFHEVARFASDRVITRPIGDFTAAVRAGHNAH